MSTAAYRFILFLIAVLLLILLYEAGILDLVIRRILSAVTGTEDVLQMLNRILG